MAGLAVAALLVTDVVGLATHDGAASAQSIRATVAAASAHTLGSGTARISLAVHMQVSAASFKQTVDEVTQGEGDLTHRLIDMTIAAGPGVGTELRIIDGVIYEKLGPSMPRPPGVATPWVSLAAGLPASGTSPVPGVQGGSDPTQTLTQLESLSNGSVTGAEKLGSVDIKGVPTSEYRLDLDAAKVEAGAQAGAAYLGGLIGQQVPSMTIHSMTMTVWIDAQGLIRQQDIGEDISVSVGGFTGRVEGDVTADYWDFGVPVDIQAPPPSEVTPVNSLTAGASTAQA